MSPLICVFAGVKEKQYDWHTMTNETRDMLVEECGCRDRKHGNTILGSSAKKSLSGPAQVGQILKQTVWALQRRSKR